ncbi:uncharacterized protein LOC117171811 isoform X1 [Belonocnema kinseyi]|uniref:uncharacterized protein LOC117171811 isoform X1 n=1 Tax=Belonocnema kinseyi TaxID=2817044 RepID=UPI00143DEC32|nr:uncharacterized protein LOC117171811 isoform X1 [Belonocnema kinseyi]
MFHDQHPRHYSVSQSSIHDNEKKHEKSQLDDGEKSRKQKYGHDKHSLAKDSKSHVNEEQSNIPKRRSGKKPRDDKYYDKDPRKYSVSRSSNEDNKRKYEKHQLDGGKQYTKQKYDDEKNYTRDKVEGWKNITSKDENNRNLNHQKRKLHERGEEGVKKCRLKINEEQLIDDMSVHTESLSSYGNNGIFICYIYVYLLDLRKIIS